MKEPETLKELIEFGSDIEFEYQGKDYVILPWYKDGILIAEQNTDTESVYPTYEELIEKHFIEGTPFKQIAENLNITFCS